MGTKEEECEKRMKKVGSSEKVIRGIPTRAGG